MSYETSYIPFLFDRDTDDDVVKPKGRRIFNKHGKEVEEVAVCLVSLLLPLQCNAENNLGIGTYTRVTSNSVNN